MKKLLLILFVIASVAKQSGAQTNVYHPFPDSNAVWREENDCVVNPHYPFQGEFHSYINFLAGDTLIGAFIYKKYYNAAALNTTLLLSNIIVIITWEE